MQAAHTMVPVKATDGAPLHAKKLATFHHVLGGKQYRFLVTELPGELPAVTHRDSGKRVCRIELSDLAAFFHNYRAAGRNALRRNAKLFGEEHVAKALSTAKQDVVQLHARPDKDHAKAQTSSCTHGHGLSCAKCFPYTEKDRHHGLRANT